MTNADRTRGYIRSPAFCEFGIDNDMRKALCGQDQTEAIRLPIGKNASDAGHAFATGEIVNDGNVQNSRTYARFPRDDDRPYQSILDVPVRVDGRSVAVLNLDADKPDAFSEDDVRSAQQFATKLAILFVLEYNGGKLA